MSQQAGRKISHSGICSPLKMIMLGMFSIEQHRKWSNMLVVWLPSMTYFPIKILGLCQSSLNFYELHHFSEGWVSPTTNQDQTCHFAEWWCWDFGAKEDSQKTSLVSQDVMLKNFHVLIIHICSISMLNIPKNVDVPCKTAAFPW